MNFRMERALRQRLDESLKTMSQSQMEHQLSTQIEKTVCYQPTTFEQTVGRLHSKQWTQLIKPIWQNQKTTEK